jgi:hypothetical protein
VLFPVLYLAVNVQLPLHFILSYWTLAVTPRLGINLKLLSLLLVVIPLALYPFVVLIGSIFAGIGLTMALLFNPRAGSGCAGRELGKATYSMTVDFWHYCFRSHVENMRSLRQATTGSRYEVSLIKLVVIPAIVVPLATAIDGLAIVVIVTIKFFPGLLM